MMTSQIRSHVEYLIPSYCNSIASFTLKLNS